LAAVKFWTRQKFKGTNTLRGKGNATRVPIEQKESVRWLDNLKQAPARLGEPARCVHVGDREGDIFELSCTAQDAGTHFLVRTGVDRLAGQGDTTVAKKMAREPVRGSHEVEVRDGHGRVSTARVFLRFCRMTVHPPVGKQKRYPPLSLTVIHAHERGTPEGREPTWWHRLTDLPVEDLTAAVEKRDWYASRWQLETYHKVLKSGCPAEHARLRTAERLTNLLAVLCVAGWRVFWLTMVNRAAPGAPPETVLTRPEIEPLDRMAGCTTPRSETPTSKRTVCHYLVQIAKLGGYLARAKDPPPGDMVIWRGLTRLTEMLLGFELKNRGCG
jgi:hypothetical protein